MQKHVGARLGSNEEGQIESPSGGTCCCRFGCWHNLQPATRSECNCKADEFTGCNCNCKGGTDSADGQARAPRFRDGACSVGRPRNELHRYTGLTARSQTRRQSTHRATCLDFSHCTSLRARETTRPRCQIKRSSFNCNPQKLSSNATVSFLDACRIQHNGMVTLLSCNEQRRVPTELR